MNDKKRLVGLCVAGLNEKGVTGEPFQKRLRKEIEEVDAQNEWEYFLDLYDRGVKIPENENNLLIPFLLGIVPDVNIDEPPTYVYGEFPDIDVDYLPEVRDYLKNEWAPKQFGRANVCNIGSYNTYGVKSALIDMARIHGKDRDAVLKVTTKLGTKDEDGDPLTWEKALAENKPLAEYCKENPEVADAARRMVGRIRSRGKHAGGLIISSVPIDSIVPLCVDADGNPVSAWTEGLNAQDLQPVGLVKFDLLVITNLEQIKECVRILTAPITNPAVQTVAGAADAAKSLTEQIQRRHKLDSIWALPGKPNWSDTSYLNDPKALELADQAKLKCVFQFDSAGIRELVKQGGVTNFGDLVAYTALYRPGPLSCLPGGTLISTNCGRKPIENLSVGDDVRYVSRSGSVSSTKHFVIQHTGKKTVYKIKLKSGKEIVASGEHKFKTPNGGYIAVKELQKGEKIYHSDTI